MRLHAVTGPKVAALSITLAYDAIAADYDDQVSGDAWMRRALHAHYRRTFAGGQRVLDVGCGTGIDAIFLAQCGVRVLGVDGSPGMIERMRHKLATTGTASQVEARVLPIEDIGQLTGDGPFDGLVSAFASLSSVSNLADFAADAARLVRPGGRVVLHMLNRFSLWECLGYLAHREWTAAGKVGRRRTREFVIGGQPVTHRLYFHAEAYCSFFSIGFAERDAYSLGAVRPPHTVRRLPSGLVKSLEWADVRAGRWPLLNNAGRFFVLDLERRRSARP